MSDGNSHFLAAIGRIDGGHAIEVADERLREVIQAVTRTGKKGEVTVTLQVGPNGDKRDKGPAGFAVTAKVTAKAPQLSFGQSFFFADPNGDLTRTPPKGADRSLFNMGTDT